MNDTDRKIYRYIQWVERIAALCGVWGMVMLIVYTTSYGGAESPTWLMKDMVYASVLWLMLYIADYVQP